MMINTNSAKKETLQYPLPPPPKKKQTKQNKTIQYNNKQQTIGLGTRKFLFWKIIAVNVLLFSVLIISDKYRT